MRNRQTEPLAAPVALALVLCLCCLGSGAQKQSQGISSSPLAAAKMELDRGNLAAAEADLWKVLSSAPQDQQALVLLGIVRGRQQRYPEAEALFKRVLQINPQSVVASRNLGNALLAQDKVDEALEQYHQAVILSPADIDLRLDVTKLELSRGNFNEALSLLNKIGPEHFPLVAIPMKAASLLGIGQRSEAERLIPRVKASPAAALELAQVFIEAKVPEAALKTLSAVSPASRKGAAQLYYLKGRALRQTGDTAGALASYRQSLAADPKSVDALVALAEVYALDKKHSDSVSMLERAHALTPDSKDVLRHLVVEAMQAGQNDKGLQAAQDLQRLSSELDDRYLIASVMLQQKQYVAATHILEDFVAQRPQDARAQLGLGIGYLAQLRYPEARQALQRSLELDSNLPEAEYQMGMLSSQQGGGREEAVRHWQRAVELQPNHAQAQFSLGTVYLESGELAQAESAFSRSLASDPSNMKTEYNLGLVLNKLGKSAEAKRHFDRYRQMQESEHRNSGNPRQVSEKPPRR